MSIYIEMLTIEIDGIDGKYIDGLYVRCEQHGLIRSYAYDEIIRWEELKREIDDHINSRHFT